MNHIKRLFLLVLVLSAVLSVGCAADNGDGDGTLDVVCTVFPQYDFARSIAGANSEVNIKMLIGAGQESHDYDPTSKDIAAVHDCDIFVYVGGESDEWVRGMLESVDKSNNTVISMMELIDPEVAETVEGMESDTHEHGAIDSVEYDEHLWTSPKNALVVSKAILEAMCERMPEAEEEFRRNFDGLSAELTELDADFCDLVQRTSSPTMIVADRFPLLYFCREYGIKYYAAFSGCAASTEPSSKTVQFLSEKVKTGNIPAVFKMDLSSGNVANTIAEETGAEVLTFYSCHTVSAEDFAGGETYVSLMRRNRDALAKSFGIE